MNLVDEPHMVMTVSVILHFTETVMDTGHMWRVSQPSSLGLWVHAIAFNGNLMSLETGTILGQEYGLAKKATAIGVRVLGDGGSGSYE